jgi:hypothetical protein
VLFSAGGLPHFEGPPFSSSKGPFSLGTVSLVAVTVSSFSFIGPVFSVAWHPSSGRRPLFSGHEPSILAGEPICLDLEPLFSKKAPFFVGTGPFSLFIGSIFAGELAFASGIGRFFFGGDRTTRVGEPFLLERGPFVLVKRSASRVGARPSLNGGCSSENTVPIPKKIDSLPREKGPLPRDNGQFARENASVARIDGSLPEATDPLLLTSDVCSRTKGRWLQTTDRSREENGPLA